MKVNLDLYRVFCTTAQLKNISKASELLYLSQPAVSRAIQQLEKQLGCVLFFRERNGVTLTPEGQRLYDDIVLPYEKICSAEARLNADVNLHSGTVNIGCSPLCLYGPLMNILEEFRCEHPGITINIDSSSTFDICDRLQTSILDYALLSYSQPIEKNFTYSFLCQNRLLMCAGTAFSELKGKPLSLKDLDSYPKVGLKPGMSSNNRELWYLSQGSKYDVSVSVNVGIQVLKLIEHNMGLGLLIDVITQRSIDDGLIFPICLQEELPSTNTYFVQNPRVQLSYAAVALKDRILNYPWQGKEEEVSPFPK